MSCFFVSTVPPRLTNDVTGGLVEVLEGSKAELVCNASGIPSPTITWYRKSLASAGEKRDSEFCTGTSSKIFTQFPPL
jgi:hypothetical protein